MGCKSRLILASRSNRRLAKIGAVRRERRHASAFLRNLLLLILTLHASTVKADFLDDAKQALTFTAFNDYVRLTLTGTLDLENYYTEKPPPGLLYTDHRYLFNPRLSLYLDGQIGSNIYAFVEARFDRGFDPTDGGAEVRLDEYALRWKPWEELHLALQVGKFGTAVGNWIRRHYSWDNPFINAPLPYENVTAVWDIMAPDSVGTFLYWAHLPESGATRFFGDNFSDKVFRLPIIWGPSYASGASISGSIDKWDFAFEVKNSALASRPESWDLTQVGFDYPTFSGRIGYSPSPMWSFGVSGSEGVYLQPEAAFSLPRGDSIGDYREILLGQDMGFAWHRFQLWAEVFQVRFEVPNVGNADLLSYYLEAKYKITPNLFVAGRWNQQFYGTITSGNREVTWGNDATRIDAVIGYRFSTYLQMKLQYSYTHFDPNDAEDAHLLATQLTFKF
jgi:hypothetical protein